MKLYNTLTKKIEDFIPHKEGEVKIYTCGPTVYHYAHIGNMRNYIGHDVLVRTLKYLGFDVTRAMNITDVGHLTSDSDSGEDKMEVAKKREGKTAYEIADFYTEAFFKDFDVLNNLRPDITERATANIDMYIKMIEKLLADDIAYKSGGNIYFDISKVNNYYCLTNSQEDNLVVGYPGWHIECSGISIKYLGEYLDIHGGGVDNIFPHHTNEIAQSEAYLGHKWCNYWFHNEHLLDDTGKMSKSHGEFLTVSLLIDKGYDPFRFLCLNSHYRKQLLFSYEALNQAEATLNKLRNKISNIDDEGNLDETKVSTYNEQFSKYLENDLNTANAISVLYELLKDNEVNGHTKLELIKKFDQVFAVDLIQEKKTTEAPEEILKLIEARNEAKRKKDFELADSIRDDLYKKGIELIDTREGTTYKIVGE